MLTYSLIHLLPFRVYRKGDLFMTSGPFFIALGDQCVAISFVLINSSFLLVAILLQCLDAVLSNALIGEVGGCPSQRLLLPLPHLA